MKRHALVMCALTLLVAPQCGDSWALGGHRVSGAHFGHFGGGAAFRGVSVARPVIFRRTVFIAPVAYYPYYPPRPAYDYPARYSDPSLPPAYYQPPPQSYPPSGGPYPPPTRQDPSAPPAAELGPYASDNAFRYRLFCPDSRKYYPEELRCASAWLRVVPESSSSDGAPRL